MKRTAIAAGAVALTGGCAGLTTLLGSGGLTAPPPAGAAVQAAKASHPAAARRVRAGKPLPGALLIADRGNTRIILVNAAHRILWLFPNARDLAKGVHLNFNDDAFVAPGGKTIVSNEEEAHTIVEIDIKTHARIHLYGVPGVRGSGPGLLNTPDDAYPLKGGLITVADAYNCRILFIKAHRIVRRYGRTGVCAHDPPRTFGSVNGDTPTPGGGMLVSEIDGAWIDAISAGGKLLYAFRAPVSYPSDPQPLSGGRILLADYTRPGAVLITNHRGKVLWRYAPASGPGELDHPSLAIMLPNGNIAVNDDYRHRVVVIDPRTNRIVWQYGQTDRAGTARNMLHTPDGMDFVPLSPGGKPEWAAVHHP